VACGLRVRLIEDDVQPSGDKAEILRQLNYWAWTIEPGITDGRPTISDAQAQNWEMPGSWGRSLENIKTHQKVEPFDQCRGYKPMPADPSKGSGGTVHLTYPKYSLPLDPAINEARGVLGRVITGYSEDATAEQVISLYARWVRRWEEVQAFDLGHSRFSTLPYSQKCGGGRGEWEDDEPDTNPIRRPTRRGRRTSFEKAPQSPR